MKVVELRREIEKKEKKELTQLIVELYKIIPKGKKEDSNIDNIIINGIGENKKQEKSTNVDIEQLSKEIEFFIKLAYTYCYIEPNRIVPKKERPKWRFKVKRYYKELQNFHGEKATKLLIYLYSVLNNACNDRIFSSDDPYRSAGIVQTEMLNYVFQCVLYDGPTTDHIKTCIDILLSSNIDGSTIHSELISEFIFNLKTNPSKELAISLLEEMKNELLNKCEINSKNHNSSKQYKTRGKVNIICETILRLNIGLSQYDAGINYFIKNYERDDKEIKYYVLLEMLEWYKLKDQWLATYEKVMNKIRFSDGLKKEYEYIKKHGKFMSYD